MYARVWKVGILPGKAEEFAADVKSLIPAWRKMSGFRGLFVLRTGTAMLEGTVVSLWETLEALRDSENSTFRQAVVRILSFCEPHPLVREEEVLVCDFASPEPSDITVIS
jgi:heme-degrading monooxygenase HmoA